MKTNWQTKKLGEVWWEEKKLGEILQKTETINPTQNPEKEFIYIDVSSVNNKHFIIKNTTLLKGINAPSRARKLVKKGDVIFAKVRPTLRRIAIIPKEYDGQVCSTGYFVLRAKEHINNKLLFYFLLTNRFNEEMEKLQKGTSYPAVTDNEVREQIIHYPKTFPEQQRIVAILDEAFAAIATAKENAEKNLQNARDLFESYLQSVFANPGDGWEEKKLGEISEIFGGYAFKSGDFQKNGRYQVLRMGNVRPGIIRSDESPVFIEKIDDKILSRSLLKPDDIIITQTGTRKKRDYGYTVSIDKSNYLLNQRLAAIRTSKNLDHQFFLYYSWSDNFRDQFFANETGTVGQGNVGMSAVTDAIIPLPPLPEQRSIVAKLEALSAETKKLEAIYRQKLADLDELKKSVLEKAFTGQLTMEN